MIKDIFNSLKMSHKEWGLEEGIAAMIIISISVSYLLFCLIICLNI